MASTSTNQLTFISTTGLRSINADHGDLTAFENQVINLVEIDTTPTKSFQQEKIYKVQSITEIEPFQYQVVAQRYDNEKWTEIDLGFDHGYTLSFNNVATTYQET